MWAEEGARRWEVGKENLCCSSSGFADVLLYLLRLALRPPF